MRQSLLSIVFLAIITSSCMFGVQGNGRVEEANRSVEDFSRISIGGMFEVYLEQTDQPSLKLVADENLHELIETRIENGTLYISTLEDIGRAEELDLYITFEDLESLDFSGAVSVENKGEIEGDRLAIESSGAAEIDMQLDYNEITVEISGAAEITLRGESEYLSLSSSGASEVQLFDLEVDKMRLDLSGATSAEVNVKDDLSVDASGAAEIRYRGNPNLSKTDLSGAASLKKD